MTMAVFLAVAAAAQAADTAAPVIVTASRFQTTIDSAPVNATLITAQQIAASNVATLSQLLELQGGVHIKDLFGITGSRSSADLGGFGATAGQNTLILLNGRRLNDVDLSGANLATIALTNIERVEIIHGSSAVLYGDNATSGVINIVTKNGFDQQHSSISAEVGSFSSGRLDLSHSQAIDDSVIYIAASALSSDGYRDNSDFDQQNITAELSHSDEAFSYGFRFNGNYEDLTLPGALNEPLFESTPRASTATNELASQNRNLVEAYLFAERYAAEITISDKHQEATVYGATEADLSSWSITPRHKYTVAGHELIAGLDIYFSALDTRADFGAPNINRSATTRSSQALYLTDSYTLGSASSLNLGLRRQWVDVEIENSNLSTSIKSSGQQNDALTAWEIGLNRQFNATTRGYLRWADSFRFAALDEMWSYFSGTITPLKPQTGHHVEAGAAITLAKGTDLDVNLFRMTLTNEIGFDSNAYANINFADPTRHQGANINLHRQVNPVWLATLGYGWRDATFTAGPNSGKSIPEVPEHKLTLVNTIKLNDHNRLNVDAVYTGKRYFGDDFANAGKEMSSHTLVNLGYSYTVKRWTTTLRLNNVTDKETADSGYYNSFAANPYYYYPLPGRAAYLNVGTEF
jgi:iron complex outermembrane receptor protein